MLPFFLCGNCKGIHCAWLVELLFENDVPTQESEHASGQSQQPLALHPLDKKNILGPWAAWPSRAKRRVLHKSGAFFLGKIVSKHHTPARETTFFFRVQSVLVGLAIQQKKNLK